MSIVINWLSSWNLGGKLSLIYFIPLALLILWAAIKLVKYAEVIIKKSKFGGAFVGGALIAGVTSIPELITEVTQSAAGQPGAGTADDIGSNAFSAFLIGIAAIIFIRSLFLNKVGKWTRISIGISMSIAILVSILMFFRNDLEIGKQGTFVIGLIPLSLFIIYLIVLFLQYKFGTSDKDVENYTLNISLKKSIVLFILYAVILIIFAFLLNIDVSSFQQGFAISSTSVGGIFLSITTSLPEVIAFILLLRNKQAIAAIAALIGSHIFNLGISFFGDLAYIDGATFNNIDVHRNWPIAAITAIMLGLLLIHLIVAKFKPKMMEKKKFYLIAPILIVLVYIVGWTLLLLL